MIAVCSNLLIRMKMDLFIASNFLESAFLSTMPFSNLLSWRFWTLLRFPICWAGVFGHFCVFQYVELAFLDTFMFSNMLGWCFWVVLSVSTYCLN